MIMVKENFKKKEEVAIPAVLSFEKKFVPSDGLLYGTKWNERYNQAEPIQVVEKSVRGTISNISGKDGELKSSASVEDANLQTVDYAALLMNQDTLKLHFTLKVLSGVQKPSTCSGKNGLITYRIIQQLGEESFEHGICKELAYRYAINIANVRFLWRNRIGAEKLEVVVQIKADGKKFTFNSYHYALRSTKTATVFSERDAQIEELADYINKVLTGANENSAVLFDIDAYALIGNGQEVYPSEELILDLEKDTKGTKQKGNKSKVLYQSNGMAAMHSQKLGNAIRTIDTWYPAYSTVDGVGPIAVEPYGSVTNLKIAFRKTKVDFDSLFKKWLNEKPLTHDEELFVIAVLLRGGVFGKSEK